MRSPFFRLQIPGAACLLIATAGFAFAQTGENDDAAARHFFESQIRPLLVNRCHECHGAEKMKGGLRLDTFHGFDAGGDSGPAVVRGNLDESMLIQAVRYQDPDFQMPPKKQLPASEIALLEKWVAMGAPWPESGPVRPESDQPRFSEKDRSHWAFQPVANPRPPAVAKPHAAWAKNPIDAFVLAKLDELALSPAAPADRHEFVRRATFDLHGLPPTEAEAQAFIDDRSPEAYERLIDRLLASPRYGERWAQHWLDLVRYAESDGYRQDAFRPGAWPYRDWVIRSLNQDMPYDQFVKQQLAGDEIDPKNPDILIATSYLRNGIYEYNLRDVRGQLDTTLTDITDVTGEVFLGLSFSCARCHNHKFDPILQSDYFSLRAFFEPVLWRTDLKLATEQEIASHAEKQAAWENATVDVRAKIDALVGAHVEKAVQIDRDRYPDDIKAMMAKPMPELGPLEKQLVTLANRKPEEERQLSPLRYLKTPEGKQIYQSLLAELKTFDSFKPEPLLDALVATDVGPVAPATTMKSRRGEQQIEPAFLTILDTGAPEIHALPNSTGRRTALANWIIRPDNPLSTRVIVNRVWQYHFGRGIAATASDFGNLGEVPTHPELLDWLTRRFLEGGWSLKQLHKQIMLSATYRQTSRRPVSDEIAKIDPANRYLWRFTPPRLDAEQVRDSLLMAAGELDLKEGGPSTNAMSSRRRSIYTIKKRNSQSEVFHVLDAPMGFTSTAERQRTTTPTQALFLLNGEWPLAQAKQIAAKNRGLPQLWQALLGRPPTAGEIKRAEAFLRIRQDDHRERVSVEAQTPPEPGAFKPETVHERLVFNSAEREGEDFTIEAVIELASLHPGDGVRTIASRWNGGVSSLESCGWRFGVAGAKAGSSAGCLVMHFVGENENANFADETVMSSLKLTLGTRYYVAAYASSSDQSVTFQIRPASAPTTQVKSETVKHRPLEKIGTGIAPLVLGGLSVKNDDLFDGRIEHARLSVGPFPIDSSLAPESWSRQLAIWRADSPPLTLTKWQGSASSAKPPDPRQLAFADLCHVLMNVSEFFYLN